MRLYVSGMALVAAAWLMPSCSPPGCNGLEYETKASNPLITSMKLQNQMPNDPWTVVFALKFEAQAADLGDGQAMIYLNGNSSPATIDLADVLQESDLAPDATQGIFAVRLGISNNVQDGEVIRLGTQLRGGGGGLSNCYQLDMQFAVQPLARAWMEKTSLWAHHVFDVVRRDLIKTLG